MFDGFKRNVVLILVVVEDGLVPLEFAKLMVEAREVLILVVVEDGLVLDKVNAELKKLDVLILVVVEDGLVLDLIRHY